MEITEVRIKLIEGTEDRLRGFCSVTFDDSFVVRDLKIIEGNKGPFVAMPSRKLTSNCSKCRSKNHLRAHYCNQCGSQLKCGHVEHDSGGRAKLYADIAHPVNAACREMIQKRVVEELNKELELSAEPGYSSRYDDDYLEKSLETRREDQPAESNRTGMKDEVSPAAQTGEPDATPVPAFEQVVESQLETMQRVDDPEKLKGQHPAQQTETAVPEESRGDEFGKGVFD